MISWLKKHFIPHRGNDHRPHALRRQNIRNVVIVVLFLEVFTFLIPVFNYVEKAGTGEMAAVLQAVLSDLTNQERESQNLAPLVVSPLLTKAAGLKAEDMAAKDYFAHTSPEGKTPWYWLDQVGYKYQYAGENLAINFTDSKDVTEAWMQSPTHRANIVKQNYTQIGTGVATGMYQGRETVFVAQVYANPLPEVSMLAEKVAPPVAASTPKEENKVAVSPAEAKVLSAETAVPAPAPLPNLLEVAAASPKSTANGIFIFIFAAMALILLLYILIKFKNHHLDLITNGLIVLTLIGVVILVNNYISGRNMVVLESVDYRSGLAS